MEGNNLLYQTIELNERKIKKLIIYNKKLVEKKKQDSKIIDI
jgi:hypothetical protein